MATEGDYSSGLPCPTTPGQPPSFGSSLLCVGKWEGILQWFTSQVNNAVLEGTNSLVQAAKAKARGYRNKQIFSDMIYLVAGQLHLTE